MRLARVLSLVALVGFWAVIARADATVPVEPLLISRALIRRAPHRIALKLRTSVLLRPAR